MSVPPEDDTPIDVVLTAGDLDPHVVALREFLHTVSAIEVQGVVDRGPDRAPALITCGRMRPIEVVDEERTVHLPHTVELEPAPPALPRVPPMPPFEVDAGSGSVSAPLGAIDALAEAVEALAQALGGRSVALAFFQTTDDETPFGIAGRPGEPVVLTIGEQQFMRP
ncbi:MAG: hypothetical protein M3389_15625 [Actinomycetota bacterium]|nr:hypothetical protein [Actinomycetota bacterium]